MRTKIPQLAAAVAAVAFLASGNASAWTVDESNNTVVAVGSHLPNTGYANFAEGIHANCIYRLVYFDLNTAVGKAMMATLLAARTSGLKVRIGYTPPVSTGVCNLEMVNLL